MIAARFAVQRVEPRTAEQDVVAGPAPEEAPLGAPVEEIMTPTAVENVVAGVTPEEIIPTASAEGVMPPAPVGLDRGRDRVVHGEPVIIATPLVGDGPDGRREGVQGVDVRRRARVHGIVGPGKTRAAQRDGPIRDGIEPDAIRIGGIAAHDGQLAWPQDSGPRVGRLVEDPQQLSVLVLGAAAFDRERHVPEVPVPREVGRGMHDIAFRRLRVDRHVDVLQPERVPDLVRDEVCHHVEEHVGSFDVGAAPRGDRLGDVHSIAGCAHVVVTVPAVEGGLPSEVEVSPVDEDRGVVGKAGVHARDDVRRHVIAQHPHVVGGEILADPRQDSGGGEIPISPIEPSISVEIEEEMADRVEILESLDEAYQASPGRPIPPGVGRAHMIHDRVDFGLGRTIKIQENHGRQKPLRFQSLEGRNPASRLRWANLRFRTTPTAEDVEVPHRCDLRRLVMGAAPSSGRGRRRVRSAGPRPTRSTHTRLTAG